MKGLSHTACGILVPRPRIEPLSPALEVWGLNHWTAREVPRIREFFENQDRVPTLSCTLGDRERCELTHMCIKVLLHHLVTGRPSPLRGTKQAILPSPLGSHRSHHEQGTQTPARGF